MVLMAKKIRREHELKNLVMEEASKEETRQSLTKSQKVPIKPAFNEKLTEFRE